MEKQLLKRILSDFVDDKIIVKVVENYELYKNYSLADIGIDSLALMGLMLKIEEEFEDCIDYSTFNIGDFDTIEKLMNFILSNEIC